MEKTVMPIRIAVIILSVAVLCALYFLRLYRLQIVDGDTYHDQSINSVIVTETVPASRGLILDRYGNVLVSNRTCFNMVVNHTELTNSGDPNGTLLRLINICLKYGVAYDDTLPITAAAPFDYIGSMTDDQSLRLSNYFKSFDLDAGISSADLMSYFRKHYNIPDSFSDVEARLVAGIRYELETRLIMYAPEYVFVKDVKIDFMSAVLVQNLPGVRIKTVSVREYHTSYAAHLLGRVGQMTGAEYNIFKSLGYTADEVVGKEGVEQAFESKLHGKDGTRTTTITENGAVTNVLYSEDPQPGENVTLTLDIGLQGAAEKILADNIAKLNSTRGVKDEKISGGAIVAIKVGSGDLLASASYPTYDLSKYNEDFDKLKSDPAQPLFNRAMQGIYSPGSTFKLVTAVSSLQEKVISLSTQIYDKGRFTKYPDYMPTCWIYPGSHGLIDVIEAIRVSCNYFFFTVGDELGIDKLDEYAKQFGFGEPTGIELYEDTGVLASRDAKLKTTGESWYPADTLMASIGQSINLFSPLQIAAYTATIANNGTRVATHILKSTQTYDFSRTTTEKSSEVLNTINVDPQYFKAIQTGMRELIQTGSVSQIFKDFTIPVAAKTGTAQLGEDLQNNAIFICYAPFDKPEIAVAVVIEKGGSGNYIASIAKEVLEYYFSAKAAREALDSEQVPIN
jgi:penicillin-binding protein 2